MGDFIALRRRILNLPAAGAAVAEMPITGYLEMGGDDIFLQMIPGTDDIFRLQGLTAIGAAVKLLLDRFIDVSGSSASAAG